MLEFKEIQELKPNNELLELIKNYTYTTKNGKVKYLLYTNLQFIQPTEYIITYPISLKILEYEEHDVKIELILEPYDVSTANGEMIFGMNLVFGQRERKEIGARTKRAMEEMAIQKIHPSKAPYGYIRNKEKF